MPDIELTFAASSPLRLQPLIEGAIQPEGIHLTSSQIPAGRLFWLVPHSDPFDVTEMSLTGYLWGIQHGKEWVALPVMANWVIGCHAETLCRVDRGIDRPEDLRGKRVGVPEYAVAAITYVRHAFEADHGVPRQDIRWYDERTAEGSHYRMMGYHGPEGVDIEIIPREKTVCEMLLAGELDAVTRYFGRPTQDPQGPGDRSTTTMMELAAHPMVKWLYPDRKAAAMQYTRELGHLQPIHCIVMKRPVLERHPWAAESLTRAFAESARRTADGDWIRAESFSLTKDEQRELLGDFSPVGLERNRQALERLLELAAADGFILPGRRFSVEELFPTGDLAE
jgi:4,5-dihydroxyphthalate decarboxylase